MTLKVAALLDGWSMLQAREKRSRLPDVSPTPVCPKLSAYRSAFTDK